MKKLFYLSVACLSLAACTSESLVDAPSGGAGKEGPISFVMQKKNITRSYTDMQNTGHYNFGVFAYKSTDLVNPVMPNYLVGYYDDEKAYLSTGTTVGDKAGQEDGLSYWMYEGMGYNEYKGTYAGVAIDDKYASNNANQYLKYWDKSAAYTNFIAYSPYINGSGTATYVDGTAQATTGSDIRVLNIPNGTLKDGYNDPSLAEYMYASAHVTKADYGHDVALNFQRLNAKVNIKFWEDVPGYKVRILTLQEGKWNDGVYAAPAIYKDNDHSAGSYGEYGYRKGKYYTANGVKIQFDANAEKTAMLQYEGTTNTLSEELMFDAPTDAQIGENRFAASASKTDYYAIPKGSSASVLENGNTDINTPSGTLNADLAYTGFTFHVSYELTAEDTGEKITVSDATVFVPANYCNWVENTHYTYIFKITKNTNGSTDNIGDPDGDGDPSDSEIDPLDPEVPTVNALYPIVFDNCTVEEWLENESEWNISDEATRSYHDIILNKYSVKSGDAKSYITILDITDNDTYASHGIDWDAIAIADPNGTNVSSWYSSSTKVITIPANSTAGVYTITYTCAGVSGDHSTHPTTWTENFVIGDEYAITTALAEVATNGAADAKLVFTATKDGSNVTGAAVAADQIEINYPDNFTVAQKANVFVDNTGKVTVKKNATPGVYQLVYTVDEGIKVKVATCEFEVVDKSFILNNPVVTNKAAGTVVTGSQAADATHVYTVTGGFTVSGANITVPNNTAEGTYTVTYTVDGGTPSEVVYTQTFVVKNQYAVSLSKGSLDSMVGTSGDGDTSSDEVVITITKNEVVTTGDLASSLKVVAADADNTATADSHFTITLKSANTYSLKVNRGATKQAYKVVYTGQTSPDTKYAVAEFVVK